MIGSHKGAPYLPVSWIQRMEAGAAGIVWTAAGAVLAVGVAYSVLLGPELRYYDEEHYLRLAQGLVELGRYTLDGSTPTAYRPPGYPFFLSIGVALSAGVEALRVANFLLLASSALLLYYLVKRMANPLAGLIAALMALAYPIFFFAAGRSFADALEPKGARIIGNSGSHDWTGLIKELWVILRQPVQSADHLEVGIEAHKGL